MKVDRGHVVGRQVARDRRARRLCDRRPGRAALARPQGDATRASSASRRSPAWTTSSRSTRRNIPGCTYCRPQVASVGLTEAKAKEAGHEVKVGRFPFIGNGKAIALGDDRGPGQDGVRRQDRRAAGRPHDRRRGDRADPGLRHRPDAGDHGGWS